MVDGLHVGWEVIWRWFTYMILSVIVFPPASEVSQELVDDVIYEL